MKLPNAFLSYFLSFLHFSFSVVFSYEWEICPKGKKPQLTNATIVQNFPTECLFSHREPSLSQTFSPFVPFWYQQRQLPFFLRSIFHKEITLTCLWIPWSPASLCMLWSCRCGRSASHLLHLTNSLPHAAFSQCQSQICALGSLLLDTYR